MSEALCAASLEAILRIQCALRPSGGGAVAGSKSPFESTPHPLHRARPDRFIAHNLLYVPPRFSRKSGFRPEERGRVVPSIFTGSGIVRSLAKPYVHFTINGLVEGILDLSEVTVFRNRLERLARNSARLGERGKHGATKRRRKCLDG
jgi:hypothetical protein